jgi:exopolysaccharide biosynthesis polyprenyl glycosylphosphotransferase
MYGASERVMTDPTTPKVAEKKSVAVINEVPASSLPRTAVNVSDLMQLILPEDLFLGILCLERKRAERHTRKFVLVLIDAEGIKPAKGRTRNVKGLVRAANDARRETDPAGWYKQDTILGIIFTEVGELQDSSFTDRIVQKLRVSLTSHLSVEEVKHVRVSVHTFSEDSNGKDSDISGTPVLYPDLFNLDHTKKVPFALKRVMDVVGSACALLILSPVFLVIAALVKLTSKGPVFFTQERLGQLGKPFTCLKFRSMQANNDLKIHQEFMKQVINGSHDGMAGGTAKPVFKMTNDPRITRIGKFIRRTSLDELPQFINVLRGEMSLVGPRPPLAYEYEEYDPWHRRRVLEVKPGITGLWQVEGRSRVRFDDMVRLDLQYARGWSLWLDIQILLKTPRAVVFGDGAY